MIGRKVVLISFGISRVDVLRRLAAPQCFAICLSCLCSLQCLRIVRCMRLLVLGILRVCLLVSLRFSGRAVVRSL